MDFLRWWLIHNFVCRWIGHDIVDESYAGPETGYDQWYCRRCLLDEYIIYY